MQLENGDMVVVTGVPGFAEYTAKFQQFIPNVLDDKVYAVVRDRHSELWVVETSHVEKWETGS